MRRLAVLLLLGGAIPLGMVSVAEGQGTGAHRIWLPLDTTLMPTEQVGCDAPRPADTSTVTRTANTISARAAWRDAQEALLEGNRQRARAKLEESVQADARDVRVWQELGAVLEQLSDSGAARAVACRVMVMRAATALQREDARQRWQRLLTPDLNAQLRMASRRHADGMRAAARADWRLARAAFDDVVRAMPSAPSAWRNRAVVTAEGGDWRAAQRDLEQYVRIGGPPAERVLLARALNALQRERYGVGTSVSAGLLPGGAQFATGRPAFGVLVLSAVVGSGAMATVPRIRERRIPFLDPNGEPAPYTERYRVYPYRTAGTVTALALLIGAMVEGGVYAARSTRLPVLAVRGGHATLEVAWRPGR